MSSNKLFNIISSSFGLEGKTVKIVNTRKTSDGERISDINYSKDGKTILESFCDQYINDPESYAILEEVKKFEGKHGDGTSLLTMILSYVSSASKVIPFTNNEIDRDIDYLISLINENSIDNILDIKTRPIAFKHWLKTVCKNDIIYKKLFEFYSENPKANIKSIRRTESLEKSEILFRPRSGYNIFSRMHGKFLNPMFQKMKDLRLVASKMKLDSELYKSFEDQSYKADTRLVVLCTEITDECEKLIEESKTDRIIVVRYPSKDQVDDIFQDLVFMLNCNPNEHGIIFGNVKEVKIQDDSITLYGFERASEELLEYCSNLSDNFTGTDENEKEMLQIRIANIMSDNTFDILLNPITLRRYKMLHGMVEDVVKSIKNFPKGLIIGGMSYTNSIDQVRTSPIIKIVKEIYNILHKNNKFNISIDNFVEELNKRDKEDTCMPIDLKENSIQIFETLRSFLKELAGTSNLSIITKTKWHGA